MPLENFMKTFLDDKLKNIRKFFSYLLVIFLSISNILFFIDVTRFFDFFFMVLIGD